MYFVLCSEANRHLDVETIPVNGTWFQLISNGTTTINNGTNGLQKLDLVVRHAENFGIYLLLVLTNNWNPRPLFDDITAAISMSLPQLHERQLIRLSRQPYGDCRIARDRPSRYDTRNQQHPTKKYFE
jgi:hypothetical protein